VVVKLRFNRVYTCVGNDIGRSSLHPLSANGADGKVIEIGQYYRIYYGDVLNQKRQ